MMRTPHVVGLSFLLLAGSAVHCQGAQAPRNIGVTFNGDAEALDPLALGQWHTITASYRYEGKIDLLTNTFMVIAKGGDLLSGLDVGYNLPANQLMIVKHGFWNATEATGTPGQVGQIIENDQASIDCEATRVDRTDDDIVVSYRLMFKEEGLKGSCNVFLYIEDKDVNYDGFTVQGAVTIDRDTAVHRTDMPTQWTNALKPVGEPSEPLTLAEAQEARYALVIPRDAKRIERKAAGDLALYLNLMCGATFQTASDADLPRNDGTPYISIGRTALLAASTCAWRNDDLAAEGYAIEVVGRNVYLYGGGGRGLMHAVYSLLEEDLGCRWYATTSVDTPRIDRLSVSLVPRRVLPVLTLRDPYIHTMHDPNWSLKNKTNTPHARVPMAWGGSIRYHNMGHTYARYFPTAQYFAEHPEYYALVDGKRQPTQLCHTNPDVIRLSIEKTCEIFRSHPEVTITAIGPNDGRGFCDCPDCKALDDENGGRSGSFFYHVNQIAAGVKKEFPNNHLISLAYLDYAQPPTKLKVDDYVIVQLCTDSHAWKYQFCYVWESTDFQRMIKAWQAVKATVFVWDYTTDYVHFLLPMANWPVVAENTRFNIRHGATGIMYESELNDIDEMRGWVWAKQLWNPELDTKTLMEDFVFGYYKQAAEPIWNYQMMMWDYWETWHKVPHVCGEPSDNPLLNNLQCSYSPDGPMFTADFMLGMRRSFAEAESRAAGDPAILARVKRAKLPLLYLELAQNLGYITEFGEFVYGKSLKLPRDQRQAFRPLLDEFVDLCQAHAITTLGIPTTFEKLTTKWSTCIDAETAALPKISLPAEWIFRADPDNRGENEAWASDPAIYAAARRVAGGPGRPQEPVTSLAKGLSRLHINRGVGWEQQGYPGLDGPGWYFQSIDVPSELAAMTYLYVHVLRVNEEAWVYVDGKLAAERSYASTGKGPGELIGLPLGVDVTAWSKPGATLQIAIRVSHATGLGGILGPAMLVGTDEECSAEELDRFRY